MLESRVLKIILTGSIYCGLWATCRIILPYASFLCSSFRKEFNSHKVRLKLELLNFLDITWKPIRWQVLLKNDRPLPHFMDSFSILKFRREAPCYFSKYLFPLSQHCNTTSAAEEQINKYRLKESHITLTLHLIFHCPVLRINAF